jgi:hypothetical protein
VALKLQLQYRLETGGEKAGFCRREGGHEQVVGNCFGCVEEIYGLVGRHEQVVGNCFGCVEEISGLVEGTICVLTEISLELA